MTPPPKPPISPRSMGQRGGTLALGLWGAAALGAVLPAQADDTQPPAIQVAQADPTPAPAYGIAPIEPRPMDPYPYAAQGRWMIGTSGDTFEVIGHAYTVTVAGAVQETGQAHVTSLSANPAGGIDLQVTLSDRKLAGKPAPNTTETWTVSPDGSTLRRGATYRRAPVDVHPMPEYGVPIEPGPVALYGEPPY